MRTLAKTLRAAAAPIALIGLALLVSGSPLAADVLHYDDVIITGSTCVGWDCVNGESFGYDTSKLKENNLRLFFEDTSAGSFPSGDWRIRINDTTSGGASYFAIEDASSGKTPFRIETGAPNHALYVEDYGRVGLGTSIPYVELHIVDGDSPTIRLDQDGSSGWTAQRWDIVGNETNFFVRDVTNGSRLPFRIQPGTPSSTLNLRSGGNVGIGTWSPSAPLEVETTGRNATLVLDRTDGSTACLAATEVGLAIGEGTSCAPPQSSISDASHTLSVLGSVAGSEFAAASSRELKTDFAPVRGDALLEALAALPVLSWRYRRDGPSERHIGPMAEDFLAAFGLGDGHHISSVDSDGVALAAIQELYRRLEEQTREIARLRQRLQAVEARDQRPPDVTGRSTGDGGAAGPGASFR